MSKERRDESVREFFPKPSKYVRRIIGFQGAGAARKEQVCVFIGRFGRVFGTLGVSLTAG